MKKILLSFTLLALLSFSTCAQAQKLLGDPKGGADWIDVGKQTGLLVLIGSTHQPGMHKVKLDPTSLAVGEIVMPKDEKAGKEFLKRGDISKEGEWGQVDKFIDGLPLSDGVDKAALKKMFAEQLDGMYKDPDNRNLAIASAIMLASCYQIATGKKLDDLDAGKLAFMTGHDLLDDKDFVKATTVEKQMVWENLMLITILVNVLSATADQTKAAEDKEIAKKTAYQVLNLVLN